MKSRAVLRCDASPSIGAGHVTRCLALAEQLKNSSIDVTFAIRKGTCDSARVLPESSFDCIELTGSQEQEADELKELLRQGCDVLIVDHYDRDIAFERQCRGWARMIVALDDSTGRHHDCDIVVDSAAPSAIQYRRFVPDGTQILTGPEYALLRGAFTEKRSAALARRDGRAVRNVFVSFGATDPWNVTPIVLEALNSLSKEISITVAISAQAAHFDRVQSMAGGSILLASDVLDIAELMANADLAIGAAGATAFERAVLGLPSIVATLVENQRGISKLLFERGAAADAGPNDRQLAKRIGESAVRLIDAPECRIKMAHAASSLVDGSGAHRVVRILEGCLS